MPIGYDLFISERQLMGDGNFILKRNPKIGQAVVIHFINGNDRLHGAIIGKHEYFMLSNIIFQPKKCIFASVYVNMP